MRNLKEYRTDVLRLSQNEMGELLGVTGVTYGQWETGRRTPSATTLQKMADKFEVVITIKSDGIYFTPEIEWTAPADVEKSIELAKYLHFYISEKTDSYESRKRFKNTFTSILKNYSRNKWEKRLIQHGMPEAFISNVLEFNEQEVELFIAFLHVDYPK